MTSLTDIEVTYNTAMGPPKYTRVVNNINQGNETQVFLWFKRGQGEPVVDLQVIYGDETPTPRGFTKLARDLTKGVEPTVFLCVRRRAAPGETKDEAGDLEGGAEATKLAPIAEIRVAYGDDGPLKAKDDDASSKDESAAARAATQAEAVAKAKADGWERLPNSLTGPASGEGTKKVYLWFKRRAADADGDGAGKWSPHDLKVGDWCDCMDNVDNWSTAQVKALKEEDGVHAAQMSFKGWSDKFDEWVAFSAGRLAEFGTKAEGGTRYDMSKKMGQPWEVSPSEIDEVKGKIEALRRGDLPGGHTSTFWRVDLPDFVDKCMSRALVNADTVQQVVDDDGVDDADGGGGGGDDGGAAGAGPGAGERIEVEVNGLIQTLIELIVEELKQPHRVTKAVFELLQRVLNMNDLCKYFYRHWGRYTDYSETDVPSGGDGPFAAQQKHAQGESVFLLSNVNYFGSLGGFDAILRRIERTDEDGEADSARLAERDVGGESKVGGGGGGGGGYDRGDVIGRVPLEELEPLVQVVAANAETYAPTFLSDSYIPAAVAAGADADADSGALAGAARVAGTGAAAAKAAGSGSGGGAVGGAAGGGAAAAVALSSSSSSAESSSSSSRAGAVAASGGPVDAVDVGGDAPAPESSEYAQPGFGVGAQEGDTYFQRFQKAVFRRLTDLTDGELRALDQSKLTEVLTALEELLPVVLKGFQADELVEMFQLMLARRLLTCPYLNKQLKGADTVREWMKRVRRRERKVYYGSHGGQDVDDDSDDDSDDNAVGTNSVWGRNRGYVTSYSYGVTSYGGYGYNYGPPKPPKKKAKWLTSAYLTSWVLKQEIVSLLLKRGTHVELLKKSGKVLRFLGRQNAITAPMLSLLWSRSQRTTDTEKLEVFKIVEAIAPQLPLAMLDTLYAKIRDDSEKDERTVGLIKRFTLAAISRETELKVPAESRQWYGIELLWATMTNGADPTAAPPAAAGAAAAAAAAAGAAAGAAASGAVAGAGADAPAGAGDAVEPPASVILAATVAVTELLSHHECQPSPLLAYCERAVANLRAGVAVPQCLHLLHGVVSSLPVPPVPPHWEGGTVVAFVSQLEETHRLLALVISDCARFAVAANAAAVRAGVEERAKALKLPSVWQAPLFAANTATLEQEIKQRLDFIRLLLQHSALVLSFSDAAALFSAFSSKESALCEEQRSHFFSWLQTLLPLPSAFATSARPAAAAGVGAGAGAGAGGGAGGVDAADVPEQASAEAAGPGPGPGAAEAEGVDALGIDDEDDVRVRIFSELLCAGECAIRARPSGRRRRRGDADDDEDHVGDQAGGGHLDGAAALGSVDDADGNGDGLSAGALQLDVSAAEYACCESFFRFINGTSRRMRSATQANNNFVVEAALVSDLRGAGQLWNVALLAKGVEVRRTAQAFLIALHLRLGKSVDKKAVWTTFIERCMGAVELSIELASASSPSAQLLAEAVTMLISQFLSEVKSDGVALGGGMRKWPYGWDGWDKTVDLKINVDVHHNSDKVEMWYKLPRECTVAELRDRVGADYLVPGNCIRLIRGGTQQEMTVAEHDLQPLKLYPSLYWINGYVLPQPTKDLQGHVEVFCVAQRRTEEEKNFAQGVLANNETYFDLLFALLSMRDQGIVDRAWRLLQLLPTNQRMMQDIETLLGRGDHDHGAGAGALADEGDHAMIGGAGVDVAGPVPWNELLPSAPESRLKLLYSLEIVVDLILPSAPAQTPALRRQLSKSWSQSFVELGGVQHLFKIITTGDKTKVEQFLTTPLATNCTALLLQVYTYFTQNLAVTPQPAPLAASSSSSATSGADAGVGAAAGAGDATSALTSSLPLPGTSSSSSSSSAGSSSSSSPLVEGGGGIGGPAASRGDGGALDMSKLLVRLLQLLRVASQQRDAGDEAFSDAGSSSGGSRTTTSGVSESKESFPGSSGATSSASTAMVLYGTAVSSSTTSAAVGEEEKQGGEALPGSPGFAQARGALKTRAEVVRLAIDLLVAIVKADTQDAAAAAAAAAAGAGAAAAGGGAVAAGAGRLLSQLYDFPDAGPSLMHGLLKVKSKSLRVQVMDGLFKLCCLPQPKGLRAPRDFFMSLLLDALIEVQDHATTCEQYFQLVARLTTLNAASSGNSTTTTTGADADATGVTALVDEEETCSSSNATSKANRTATIAGAGGMGALLARRPALLGLKIGQMLLSHQVVEVSEGGDHNNEGDKVLQGLLSVLAALLKTSTAEQPRPRLELLKAVLGPGSLSPSSSSLSGAEPPQPPLSATTPTTRRSGKRFAAASAAASAAAAPDEDVPGAAAAAAAQLGLGLSLEEALVGPPLGLTEHLFTKGLFFLPYTGGKASSSSSSSSSEPDKPDAAGEAPGGKPLRSPVHPPSTPEARGELLLGAAGKMGAGGNPPPLCKVAATRALCFTALVELGRGPGGAASFNQLCRLSLPHHTVSSVATQQAEAAAAAADKWKIWTSKNAGDAARSPTGYVGLKNLGCICYMNATNQQLFMVPGFRRAIMMADVEAEEESVMFQVQKMMAALQESEKQYFNPQGLCTALKDWEGNSVNVMVQDDASGYVNNLFQKIDDALCTAKVNPLKAYFRGVFGNEMSAVSKKTPGKAMYKELRDEDFYYISLGVKGVKNIEDGLKTYMEGETMDGYKWNEGKPEEEKVESVKKVYVKKLPRHLILHLKRFEADYSSWPPTFTKLNDRVEFPVDLDMKPYTRPSAAMAGSPPPGQGHGAGEGEGEGEGGAREAKEGKGVAARSGGGADDEAEAAAMHPESYYQYRLAGVVVHRGSFNSGHYYSFIRTRDPFGHLGADVWNEFNDSLVTPFDPKDIPRKCFGSKNGYASAFLLVYDRVQAKLILDPNSPGGPRPMASFTPSRSGPGGRGVGGTGTGGGPGPPPMPPMSLPTAVRIVTRKQKMMQRHRLRSLQELQRGRVPRAIMRGIVEENKKFWRKRNIFDTNYFAFIVRLVEIGIYANKSPAAIADAHKSAMATAGSATTTTTTMTTTSGAGGGGGGGSIGVTLGLLPDPAARLTKATATTTTSTSILPDDVAIRSALSSRVRDLGAARRLLGAQLGTLFVLGTLSKAESTEENATMAAWTQRLRQLYDHAPEGADWLVRRLINEPNALQFYLLELPRSAREQRVALAALLAKSLGTLAAALAPEQWPAPLAQGRRFGASARGRPPPPPPPPGAGVSSVVDGGNTLASSVADAASSAVDVASMDVDAVCKQVEQQHLPVAAAAAAAAGGGGEAKDEGEEKTGADADGDGDGGGAAPRMTAQEAADNKARPVVVRAVDCLMLLYPNLRLVKNREVAKEYFTILAAVAEASPSARRYLLGSGAVPASVDMLHRASRKSDLAAVMRLLMLLIGCPGGGVSSSSSSSSARSSSVVLRPSGGDGAAASGGSGDGASAAGQDSATAAAAAAAAAAVDEASADAAGTGAEGGDAEGTTLRSRIAAELSAADREALSSAQFGVAVMRQMASTTQATHAAAKALLLAIMRHVLTAEQSIEMCAWPGRGLSSDDTYCDAVKAHFKALGVMLAPGGRDLEARIETGMSALLAGVKDNEKFYRMTEYSATCLLRLAKRNADVERWLRTHLDDWAWLEEWLSENKKPPGGTSHYYAPVPDDTDVALYKPGNPDSAQSSVDSSGYLGYSGTYRTNYYTSGYGSTVDNERSKTTVPRTLRMVKSFRGEEGKPPGERIEWCKEYDSDDDPYSIIGRHISVNWAKTRYICQIKRYDPDRGKHSCVYVADSDQRWYRIGYNKCENWFFVASGDADPLIPS